MHPDSAEINEIDVIGLAHRVFNVLVDQQNGAAGTACRMQ
jgi:hypothetical protein